MPHILDVALSRSHRHAEHFAPLELHGHVGVDALASLEGGGLAGKAVVDDVGHGCRREFACQVVVAFPEHQGSGAIAEEHAGLALCPVDHARHLFGTYI